MNGFCDLGQIDDIFTTTKTCHTCWRPVPVCLCSAFPTDRLNNHTRVIILQHPAELKRRLSTVPLLTNCLQHIQIINGRKFTRAMKTSGSVLDDVVSNCESLFLYPGPLSVPASKYVKKDSSKPLCLIVLDGTWPQTTTMFENNSWLSSLPQVSINGGNQTTPDAPYSHYVIKTQPREGCLCTLESVAFCLAQIEKNTEYIDVLMKPLKLMCDFQLDHGAVVHHSKQWLKENGLYKKTGTSRKQSYSTLDAAGSHTA